MLESILGALLPMVVTFPLGFVAAWRGDFGPKDAAILNRTVLLYDVPLLLFAGTVSTPRAELSQDRPLIIALCVAIVGLQLIIHSLSLLGHAAGGVALFGSGVVLASFTIKVNRHVRLPPAYRSGDRSIWPSRAQTHELVGRSNRPRISDRAGPATNTLSTTGFGHDSMRVIGSGCNDEGDFRISYHPRERTVVVISQITGRPAADGVNSRGDQNRPRIPTLARKIGGGNFCRVFDKVTTGHA